jgi:hypothetical protein
MTPFWWGFIAGCFVGGAAGFVIAALLAMAGRSGGAKDYARKVKRGMR